MPNARIICGLCKQETAITSEQEEKILSGEAELFDFMPCGHKSYNSSMKARLKD